jgi:lysophospholipase
MPATAFDRRIIPAGAEFSVWSAPDGWPYRLLRRARKGRGARGSLIFAGGRGDFIEKYLEAGEHWHRRGWDVTAFDWRGQGATGGHSDSFDRMVDDLAALIADWRLKTPPPHVAVGHSMGGHLLLRTLAERQPELRAAVLVAPMIRINSGPLPPFAAAWTASAMTAFGLGRHPAWQQPRTPPRRGSMRQSILTGCPDRYEDELWWWRKEPRFNLGAPSWEWLRAAYSSSTMLTPERLRKVILPVLLLGTEHDRLVSPAAIRETAGLLPNAELLMFEDAAHEILREADPVRERAFERIDSFLDAHAAR